MGQYKTGTVSVTNGSPTVTGLGTSWNSLSTPLYFKIDADGSPVYEVASIDSDTQITLAGNYQGSTQSGLQYQLVQDFSTNLGIPLPSQGDADAGDWLRRAIVEIDQWLFGPKWGANLESLSSNKTLTISSARLQFFAAQGADRTVTLPAEPDSKGIVFIIFETLGSYSLLIKDDSAGLILTIGPQKAGLVACNGTSWKGLLGS